MEDNLTLGQLVLARLAELHLDLEGAATVTGISERHLRRILEDEGHAPWGSTIAKLERLGIERDALTKAASRTKIKALQVKIDPALTSQP